MHEATLSTVAGSVTAVDLVMSGEYKHALHLAGGFIMHSVIKQLASVYIMMLP